LTSSVTVLRVALDVPLARLFDYLPPAGDSVDAADLGRRVRVPFGRREQVGILVALAGESEIGAEALRPALAVDRTRPPLPADILELVRFAADYYRHPYGAALLAILPPALKRQHFRAPPPTAFSLTEAGRAAVTRLSARATAQRQLAERLTAGAVLTTELAAWRALLRGWVKRGWVHPAGPDEMSRIDPADAESLPALTPAQATALAELDEAPAGFAAWLLFGVTGSGKTEVYLRQIATHLARGEQILLLVPEIHLTPQLTERLAARLPGRHLVSLHSGMNDGERLSAWLAAAEGRAEVVLGTRLAVFTPLPRLGLILVDEEHDAAYKQMEGLRYSARDVAVWRARQRGIPVLLGSASPALETWHNVERGRYRLLELPERAVAQASLPAIRLIDTRRDRPRHGLSAGLVSALNERLARGEQSLVFINRRGYAPTLYCQSCGHISDCPRCAAHLVVHRRRQGFDLRCHHCGLGLPPPTACPACGSLDLRPFGQGTQKVEDALVEHFPNARILRIDRDSVARKGAFAAMRAEVEARAVDILVGTQIVAKGHDFPHLTLVGVVGADQALMSPDFRAAERLFAQLLQVSGRAGRAEQPGEVWLQTDYPHHPLYAALLRHDYRGFAASALAERRGAECPPYTHQALLRAEASELARAIDFLDAARSAGLELAALHPGVVLFDPVPAVIARVAHRARAQLLLQARQRSRLQAFLAAWAPGLAGLAGRAVQWSLDVDPLEM